MARAITCKKWGAGRRTCGFGWSTPRPETPGGDELFESFESGVDYPVANVWAELADYYPDARVILTVRDPERWWESTNSTIYGFRTAFAPWFLACLLYTSPSPRD